MSRPTLTATATPTSSSRSPVSITSARPISGSSVLEQLLVLCHCEERSDEAIQCGKVLDCFASLAMTSRVDRLDEPQIQDTENQATEKELPQPQDEAAFGFLI